MTVCLATLCRWNYGTKESPQLGIAAITASDRMITAGDVEYEPRQIKASFINERTIILIAGSYAVHTEALRQSARQIRASGAGVSVENIASIYGRAIQTIKQREAEDIYLAPLGLNLDTFIAQQREMATAFVDTLTTQMQAFSGEDVEALVVGLEDGDAHIFTVDTRGTVNCFDDIGFAAIGIGAWHARSRLMQLGYTNTLFFIPALAATFAAKKTAETAPGVGSETDIHLVLRGGVERLHGSLKEKLPGLYREYDEAVTSQAAGLVRRLQETLDELLANDKVGNSGAQNEPAGEGQPDHASAGSDGSKAP